MFDLPNAGDTALGSATRWWEGVTYDTLPAKVVREGGTVLTFEEPRRAFKKVDADGEEVVCTLIVPAGARVVYPQSAGSWNNEHLRIEAASVHEIDADTTLARSIINPEFLYREGERVVPEQFSDDVTTPSAPGIHVFATRKGAEHW